MKAKLTIYMDNAAFGDNPMDRAAEVGRILSRLAGQVVDAAELISGDVFPLVDVNGNRVGELEIMESASSKSQREYQDADDVYRRA